MGLSELITTDAIIPTLKANSKKQVLKILSEKASGLLDLDERVIFDVILQREKLGSTVIGDGIAIPHGKLLGIKQAIGVFARLESPVDFETADSEPVDLVFLLLVPECSGIDHLKILSQITRILRCVNLAQKLRDTGDVNMLYSLLAQNPPLSTS